jgi:ubiquinone/menaquinone biosynthesis C-methylase UbiE
MKRFATSELLDDDLGSAAEIAESLADLRRINAWFGGTHTTLGLLRRIAARQHLREMRLLEVGAGGGDVPLSAGRALRKEGVELRVTLLDRVSSHLPVNGTPAVAGDAVRLPFRAEGFEVVSCNLLAHHFDPDGLLRVASEALRVARVAVLINDLIRSPLHLALVYAGLPLFRSRITWHDAPASVRQAYTMEEMRDIVTRSSARRVEISRHYLYRMGVVLWK